MEDTSDSIKKFFNETMMKKSPVERFLIGIDMFETARSIVLSSFSKDMTSAERFYHLFLRFYGHEFSDLQKAQIKKRMLAEFG